MRKNPKSEGLLYRKYEAAQKSIILCVCLGLSGFVCDLFSILKMVFLWPLGQKFSRLHIFLLATKPAF